MDARKGATFTEIEEVGGACICHGGLAVFARKLTDLIRTRRDKFDAVVVETTGLADPAFAQVRAPSLPVLLASAGRLAHAIAPRRSSSSTPS